MSDNAYVPLQESTKGGEESTSIFTISKDKKNKILYIVIFTFLAFTIEYLIREPFTDLSEWIQERLNFTFKCELGSYFLWFKYQGKTFIFLFVYNISNVFVSLSMIFLDSFGIFINGTLKLIYTDARPFWRNANLVPCGCATNYGNPSTTSLDEYLVCIVVFRGLINRYQGVAWKTLVWIFFLTPQILAWTSRFIQNIHSLPQLCFGLICGYIVQYIYFEILEVNMQDSQQLRKLVNTKSILLILSGIIVSWLFFNGIHYFFVHITYNQTHISNIEKYCEIIPFDLFDNESYQKTATAFLFLGSVLGIYLEYLSLFTSSYDKFEKYNMGENNWTNTEAYKVVFRIIIMVYLNKLLGRYCQFGDVKTDSLAYLNFGKCILKNIIFGLFYFFFYKLIFRLILSIQLIR
jgi:hypothetical protein